MPYHRNGGRNYTIDLRPRGYSHRVGPYSTGSSSKAVALQMEAMIRELVFTMPEAVDTLRAGGITLPALHAAKITGRLHGLLKDVTDPLLTDAIRDFLRTNNDPRYKPAMDRLRKIMPTGARVSDLRDARHVERLALSYREEGLSGGTERREMSGVRLLLKQCFGKAVAAEIMDQVKLRPDSRGRTRWLTRNEIARLRECAGDWWIVIGFAIATGLRRGEIFALQVKDVEFQAGAVVVPGGKSVKAMRRVPLGGESLDALGGWVTEEGLGEADPLFGSITTHTLRKAWEQIRSAAGLADVRFHDLRHTYAVHCAKAGMPLGELQQRLGHASIVMTMRYAVYQPPMASTHYDRALSDMGLADAGAPKVASPTPPKPFSV